MSRDFILIFSGGMVSLVTTLIVLFVADYFARREYAQKAAEKPAHPPESINPVPLKEDQTV